MSKEPIYNFEKKTRCSDNSWHETRFIIRLQDFTVTVREGGFSYRPLDDEHSISVIAQDSLLGSYTGPIAEKAYYDLVSRMNKSETAKKANLKKKFKELLQN